MPGPHDGRVSFRLHWQSPAVCLLLVASCWLPAAASADMVPSFAF